MESGFQVISTEGSASDLTKIEETSRAKFGSIEVQSNSKRRNTPCHGDCSSGPGPLEELSMLEHALNLKHCC
jgi:hypothetical protein